MPVDGDELELVHLCIRVYPAGTTDPRRARAQDRALCHPEAAGPLTDLTAQVTCPLCLKLMRLYVL